MKKKVRENENENYDWFGVLVIGLVSKLGFVAAFQKTANAYSISIWNRKVCYHFMAVVFWQRKNTTKIVQDWCDKLTRRPQGTCWLAKGKMSLKLIASENKKKTLGLH